MDTPDLNNPIHAFAAALADAIGGDFVPASHTDGYRDWVAHVQASEYGVFIRQDNSGKRLEITAAAVPRAPRNAARHGWPRGTVAIGRPVSDQVRDVCRRILTEENLRPCIDETHLRLTQEAEADAAQATTWAALEAAGARRSRHLGHAFSGPAGVYCSGRVEHNGGVTFERIGSVSADQAARILAILRGGGA